MAEKEVPGVMLEGTPEFTAALEGSPRRVLFQPAAPKPAPDAAQVAPDTVEAATGATLAATSLGLTQEQHERRNNRWPGTVANVRQDLTALQKMSLNISRSSLGTDHMIEADLLTNWGDFLRQLNNASTALSKLENDPNGIA